MTTVEQELSSSGLTELKSYTDIWAEASRTAGTTLLSSSQAEPAIFTVRSVAREARERRVELRIYRANLEWVPVGQTVQAELNRIAALPPRWDGRFASAISPDAIRGTVSLMFSIMGDTRLVPQFVPLPSGGVQFEWHVGGIAVEIEVEADGSAYVFASDADGEVLVDGADEAAVDQAASLVATLAERLKQSG